MSEYVWVVGFFKGTDDYSKFIRVAKNNAQFYATLYNGEGLDAQIMNDDEFAEIGKKEQEKLDKKNGLK